MAFERFWYARGPALMIGAAYGITLLVAVLTIGSLGEAATPLPSAEKSVSPLRVARAHLLPAALPAQALLGTRLDSANPAACP